MHKKLRIAIFHLAFVYSGGGEKLVLEEAEGLRARGHAVDIFVPLVHPKTCFPDIIKNQSVYTFLPVIFSKHDTFQVLLTAFLVPFYAYRFRKYDVILAANQPSPWIAWVVKKMYGVAYVSYLAQPTRFLYPRDIDQDTGLRFTKHESESITATVMQKAKKFIGWADMVSIRDSNKILTNGEYIKKIIEKVYKVKAKSCPAGAPPILKFPNFNQRVTGSIKINGIKIDTPFILLTNRHFSQKRFEYGIFALSSILSKCPNCKLIITGEETHYTEEIKLLVERLSLQQKVIFLGYVTERDLLKLYTHTLVYIYTAPEEDFGMGVIEAMSNGAPVVAWNFAGPSKTVVDGKTGFLATPYEIADFAKLIVSLIINRKLASEMSRQAVAHVKNNFSFEKHIDTLEDALVNANARVLL